MRRSIADLFRIFIPIFFLVFIIITPVSAQNVCNWTGAGSGNSWHTAENWECGAHDGVPTADDSVTIAPAETVEVLLGDHAEARALVVGIDDDETDAESHNLKTTADNIELTIGDGGVAIHQSGRFDLGQGRTPCCVGARPGYRATLQTNGKILVFGGFYISNTTIFSDIVLTRPDTGGSRGRLQARGWNVIHGMVDVTDGFLQPVVPGGFHGDPQPHLRVVDNDILISDSSSVQIYVDSYPLGAPPPDEAPAIAVEGGILDQRGRFTTSGNPANNRESSIIIDAKVVNSGFIISRLSRAQGLSFRGPVDAVHENSGTIEIGGLLGSDTEEDAVDGFGLLIDEDRSLNNTGEIYLHRLRTAEGQVLNTDGGMITDEISVTEPGNYILGFEGPQSIQIELLDLGNIERLAMTWHGEDHPDAGLNQNIEGTRNWWDLAATDTDSLPASGNMSLSFPRLNPNTPRVCRYIDDPAGWDCLTTLVSTDRADVTGLTELSAWAVADTLIDSGPDQVDVLDPDFGKGGIITHQIQDYDVAHDVILQPDGSIITFGQSSEIGDVPQTRVGTMVRFDEDTTQIKSYTYTGTTFGCTVPQVFHAGVKLENGQFIGGGYRQDGCSGTPRYFRLIRLKENGSADHIFNDAMFNNAIAYVYDLAVQPDGKVIAAGRASTAGFDTPEYTSTFDAAIARYQTDGSLDTEFGTDGEVIVDVNGDYDFLRAITLQDDGKIIGGGFTTSENGRDFLLIRVDAGGSPDTNFGTDGLVIHDFHGFDDQIFDVAIQDDGKIVVAGRSTGADEVTVRYTISRFNSDGSPDTEFAENGTALIDFGSTDGFASVAYANAVKVDPAGRIFSAGTIETGDGEASRDVALAVLQPDGSLNTDFNSNGTAVFGYGAGPIDTGNALDIDPLTGRIAVAGYSGERIEGDLNTKAAVARLIGFKDINLPGQITLLSPVDDSEDIPLLTSLEWESVNDADQYRVQISAKNNFSSLLVDSVLSQTSLTLSEPLISATLHYWRVSGINGDGEGDWSDTWSFTTELATSAETPGNLPTAFSLHQNYPNPFNPSTVIRYDVPEPSDVLVEVFNMIGQRVATLVDGHKTAGRYSVDFNAGQLSSGMYLYRMSVQNGTPGNTSNFTAVRKLVLIK